MIVDVAEIENWKDIFLNRNVCYNRYHCAEVATFFYKRMYSTDMTDISIFRYNVLYVYIYLLAMAVETSVLEKTQKRRKEIVTTV